MSNDGKNGPTAGKIAATTVQGGEEGEHDWKKFLPLAFGGHCFYVRQDLTGEQSGDGVMEREIGGIAIPDTVADKCQTVTVLGVGPRVGQKCSKDHKAKYQWPDRFSPIGVDVKVGDRLLLAIPPGQYTDRLKRSTLNWDFECFIEESLPDGIVTDE